jgi:hypothetical protein
MSLVLMFFTGIPAMFIGVRGLRDIRRSGGELKEMRLAFAGIASGLFGTCLGATLIWWMVDRFQEMSARVD